MKILSLLLFLIIAAMLVRTSMFGFQSQRPKHYAETGPTFSLQEHLSGEILSEGIIYGPNGRMTNSFVAKMRGDWDGATGTLSEEFTYSNGKQQSRKWFLTAGPGNSFTATADDIVGEARGTVSGATIQMEYQIVLPEDSGGYVLSVTDWLYLTDSGVIMNKSELRKYGIKVAELVATMRPAPSQ